MSFFDNFDHPNSRCSSFCCSWSQEVSTDRIYEVKFITVSSTRFGLISLIQHNGLFNYTRLPTVVLLKNTKVKENIDIKNKWSVFQKRMFQRKHTAYIDNVPDFISRFQKFSKKQNRNEFNIYMTTGYIFVIWSSS